MHARAPRARSERRDPPPLDIEDIDGDPSAPRDGKHDAGGLVPAAALSAYASAGDRRKALLAGFQHHLAKPVNPTHLLSLIERMVRVPLGLAQ